LKIKTPWETEVLVIDLKFDITQRIMPKFTHKHSKVLQVNNLSAFPNVPYIPAMRTSDSGLYNHMVPIMLTGYESYLKNIQIYWQY